MVDGAVVCISFWHNFEKYSSSNDSAAFYSITKLNIPSYLHRDCCLHKKLPRKKLCQLLYLTFYDGFFLLSSPVKVARYFHNFSSHETDKLLWSCETLRAIRNNFRLMQTASGSNLVISIAWWRETRKSRSLVGCEFCFLIITLQQLLKAQISSLRGKNFTRSAHQLLPISERINKTLNSCMQQLRSNHESEWEKLIKLIAH